jgi:hypothetical protein
MKLKLLYSATAAALLALSFASFAQTQSGSSIQGGSPGQGAGVSGSPTRDTGPSTGTSADSAGASGTTSPRSPDTSVGTSGATSGSASSGSTSGRCDTLIGDERQKCLREQASTGTAGAGSTGMGSGTSK